MVQVITMQLGVSLLVVLGVPWQFGSRFVVAVRNDAYPTLRPPLGGSTEFFCRGKEASGVSLLGDERADLGYLICQHLDVTESAPPG
jgi:hypothetical protein